MSSLQKEAMRRNMPSGLPPRPPNPASMLFARSANRRAAKDYSPLSWSSYFETFEDVIIHDAKDTFRVYLSGFQDTSYGNKPLLLLLHGGGYSALSWSLFAKSLQELCHIQIVAIDLRSHGSTETSNDDDLSIQTMSSDVAHVYKSLVEKDIIQEETPVILMGHSMGGAIAVHVSKHCSELIPSIFGLVVIDVVEGTALEALQGMQCVLRSRPKQFPTLENAIEWSLRSGQTKNHEAARISMPGMLKKVVNPAAENARQQVKQPVGIHAISENEEGEESGKLEHPEPLKPHESSNCVSDDSHGVYTWRTNLFKSEIYWKGWFEGLSQLFLDSNCQAKLLLLAGIDRLDKTLTVGQMQGKFQMQVLPDCGHAVHEDVPEKVSEVVATFLIRHRLTESKKDFGHSFPAC